MTTTHPDKYNTNLDRYLRDINNNLQKYKDTYVDYMNHVYSPNPDNETIGEYCEKQQNKGTSQCSNQTAKLAIDTNIKNMRNDIASIKNDLKVLGNSVQKTEKEFNKEEVEYASEQNKLKNIKQKNAESIMMKKITEDNQAINIVESVYLISGIAFMIFFIVKQLNK